MTGTQTGDSAQGQCDGAERVADAQPVVVGEDGGPQGEGDEQRNHQQHPRQRLPGHAALGADQRVDAEPQDDGKQYRSCGDADG
ncbi:hypothetical protein [Streptomyces sp. NPDC002573]|uniref:hypothetical protein n=1 Tax=Streptomyces sp. NPDC002573 TaxID=3364651 RepID=UPI0036CAA3ED